MARPNAEQNGNGLDSKITPGGCGGDEVVEQFLLSVITRLVFVIHHLAFSFVITRLDRVIHKVRVAFNAIANTAQRRKFI